MSTKRKSIADDWKIFQGFIIPKSAGAAQRIEMKRAFYAGAASLFGLMTGEIDGGTEPTEGDLVYVSSLEQELRQFAADMRAGKA